MSASPKTIWQVPAYLPYLQPPLTDQAIAAAEQKIGFRLPESYLSLLREQNGGYLRYGLPESVHSLIAGIGPFYPSLVDFDWDNDQEYVSFKLKGLIPFDGDGHWHLCLDYRSNPTSPSVAFIDIECDDESEIAPSFDDYLSLLQIEVNEGEFVLPNISDLCAVLLALSSKLGVKFEPPDSYAYGYPTYRARGGTETHPEWIWISPNLVPRGFVREDDKRFEELQNLMSGDAPRYPQLPDQSYLLTATDGFRPTVLQACRELSFDLQPIKEYIR